MYIAVSRSLKNHSLYASFFQPIDTALIEDKDNINSGGLKTMNNCLQLAGKRHAGWPSLNEKPSSTARRLPAGPLCASLLDMKTFELSDIFELKYPDNWKQWLDNESGLECFCDDSENANGVLQLSFYSSTTKTFNAIEELTERDAAEIIILNGNLTVYFEEYNSDYKSICWVTGKDELMFFLTYTFNFKSDFEEELAVARKILTTLKIKTST